jgi:signal peptidase
MTQSKYTAPEQIEAMRRELAYHKRLLYGSLDKDEYRQLRRKRRRKLIGRLSFAAVVLILAAAIGVIQSEKSSGEIPGLLGFHLFSIESGSMEPTLNVGSIILSRRPGQPAGLRSGDIVTFKTAGGAVVTHRIIEVLQDSYGGVSYKTKGDNPVNSPDQELLTPDRVISVYVTKIPLT